MVDFPVRYVNVDQAGLVMGGPIMTERKPPMKRLRSSEVELEEIACLGIIKSSSIIACKDRWRC